MPLKCAKSCWWLFWHFRWSSQSPHSVSSGHKSLKLNCYLSQKTKQKTSSVTGQWEARDTSVNSRHLYCINGEEFQSLMVPGRKEPPRYCVLVVMTRMAPPSVDGFIIVRLFQQPRVAAGADGDRIEVLNGSEIRPSPCPGHVAGYWDDFNWQWVENRERERCTQSLHSRPG